MRSIVPLVLILAGAGVMVPSLALAQTVIDKTTLGQSQNDQRDLANSLVAGPQKYGKGEKKAQISASELKSKGLKDSTFGGSLLNMGIDPSSQPKLDTSKERIAPSEIEKRSAVAKEQAAATQTESSASKPSTAAEKEPDAATQPAEDQQTFSNLSMTATLADSLSAEDAAAALSKASSSSADAHNKDQAGTSGEKTSTATSSDKSSDTKPDGH